MMFRINKDSDFIYGSSNTIKISNSIYKNFKYDFCFESNYNMFLKAFMIEILIYFEFYSINVFIKNGKSSFTIYFYFIVNAITCKLYIDCFLLLIYLD